MSSLYADYDKLNASLVHFIEFNASDNFSNIKSSVSSGMSNLNSISSIHDGCFDCIQFDSINTDIDQVSEGINSLVGDISYAKDTSLEYSLGLNSLGESEMAIFDSIYSIDSVKDNGVRGEIGLDFLARYLNSTFDDGNRPLNFIITKKDFDNNYSASLYNNYLDTIDSSISSQRGKAVAKAMLLATTYPHLSYIMGGGHHYSISKGIDPNWGVSNGNDKGIDCTGFINWVLSNSGVGSNRVDYNTITSSKDKSYYNLGNVQDLSTPGVISSVRAGDLLFTPPKYNSKGERTEAGHIGIVVYKTGNNVIAAHCSSSGGGMNLTKIDLDSGVVVDDSSLPDRIGTKDYFVQLIEVDYEDEINNKKRET